MNYKKDNKGFRFLDSLEKSNQYSQILILPDHKCVYARRTGDDYWDCIDMSTGEVHFMESECEPLIKDAQTIVISRNNHLEEKTS